MAHSSKQSDLRKGIHLYQLFTLVIGTIVGVGWIMMTGTWIETAGVGGSILAFLIGGFALIPIALCYVEVATQFSQPGGELIYAYEAFDERIAFIAGWLLLYVFINLIAFEAISAAWILTTILPNLTGTIIYDRGGYQISSGSLIIMMTGMSLFTWVNFRGGSTMASVQDVLTYSLITGAIVFIISGIWEGDIDNVGSLIVFKHGEWIFSGIVAVFITTPVWLMGFSIMPQALGEVKAAPDPRLLKTLIICTLIFSCIFYSLIILSAGMAAPRQIIINEELAVMAALQHALNSQVIGKFILFVGFLGILTTWNAMFYCAARVLFALSRYNIIPPTFSKIHPRHGSPYIAVFFAGIIGMILALGGKNMIGVLVSSAALVIPTLYIITCMALFRLRTARSIQKDAYLVPYYPWLPIAALIYALCIELFGVITTWNNRTPDSIPAEWVILLIWAILGVIFMLVGKHTYDPITIDEK